MPTTARGARPKLALANGGLVSHCLLLGFGAPPLRYRTAKLSKFVCIIHVLQIIWKDWGGVNSAQNLLKSFKLPGIFNCEALHYCIGVHCIKFNIPCLVYTWSLTPQDCGLFLICAARFNTQRKCFSASSKNIQSMELGSVRFYIVTSMSLYVLMTPLSCIWIDVWFWYASMQFLALFLFCHCIHRCEYYGGVSRGIKAHIYHSYFPASIFGGDICQWLEL